MWSAWIDLKMSHRRPSDDLALTDTIAAYCVDKTVIWFGITVENMLGERVNQGTQKEPQWEAKYTLEQLLDASYHPPRPMPTPKIKPMPAQSGFAAMMAMAAQSGNGIKRWEYVKPS